MLSSTDPTLQPQTRAYVVYDKRTGEILRVHRSVTFPKSPPPREKPEERARRLAGTAAEHADVVEVAPNEINDKKPLRVDVVTRRLVAGDD
jgi:hypothetical protein